MIMDPQYQSDNRGERNSQVGLRAALMGLNFCLIVAAYYQIKPVCRTLFISYVGTEKLPHIWIASTLVLLVLLPLYHWRVPRYPASSRLTASCLSFILLLLLFRFGLRTPTKYPVAAFYVLVDVYSVIVVEQCWSLVNTVYRESQGKKWYGLLGSGGLLGGMLGSLLSSFLLANAGLQSVDLLLVGCILLLASLLLSGFMYRKGFLDPLPICNTGTQAVATESKSGSVNIRYVVILVLLLLLGQLVSPLVEYQFLTLIGDSFKGLEERTKYLASFFALMSMVALVINLVITPLVHKRAGAVGGLVMQPLFLAALTVVFGIFPTITTAALLKLSDRSLSYSVNRTSRELLFIPLPSNLVHRLKVWSDMLGYRSFEIIGSSLIIVLTQWPTIKMTAVDLSSVVLMVAIIWMLLVSILSRTSAISFTEEPHSK